MESLFDNKNMLMYLTYNESKSLVLERFIRILKDKVYKKG